MLLTTAAAIVGFSIPSIPRQYIDYRGIPLLTRVPQPETYGPDSISDMYGAKVVLNDLADMYTKDRLAQTPLEARTWTKEASAPYPPAVRLAHAAMFAVGEWTGIGFYGLTLALAAFFLAASAWYFLQTRWYLFPLLYLNFPFFADRFVYVQEGSYLVMLVCVMGALLLTRAGGRRAPLLVAAATVMKLLPLDYVRQLARMPRPTAWIYVGILVAGLVVPIFLWDGYPGIYTFASERKGNDWLDITGAVLLTSAVTLLLWYVERRAPFDAEDRIGWSLVPFALFAALLANSGRHLLMALIVPDRRGSRNVAAFVGVALYTLFPGVVPLGSLTYVMTGVLVVMLIGWLDHIGWDVVRNDLRLLRSGRAPGRAASQHGPVKGR